MMYHPVTRFRRNQRASPFHMSSLTSAFALGFWLRCAHGLLSRSVARRWQRRIAGVHSKSAFEVLEPSHQHQKTAPCRRTALVPRLLRNTVWFDQRCFAHTRRMSEFTNSGKTSSVSGYPPPPVRNTKMSRHPKLKLETITPSLIPLSGQRQSPVAPQKRTNPSCCITEH
jgi:hypothetical protein